MYLLPSTHEKKKQVDRLIVMQRVVVLFKNGARMNISKRHPPITFDLSNDDFIYF